jgi:hypothetical protein
MRGESDRKKRMAFIFLEKRGEVEEPAVCRIERWGVAGPVLVCLLLCALETFLRGSRDAGRG